MPLVKNAKAIDTEQKSVYEPLPRGDYLIMLESYEDKATNTGAMIKACFVICDGDYEDRKFYTNFNYENENATAAEIAARDLALLCIACEVEFDDIDLDQLEECLSVPFMANLKISKSKNPAYSDGNDIARFWSEDAYAEGVEEGTIKPRTPAGKDEKPSGTKKAPPKKPAGKKAPAKMPPRKAPPKRTSKAAEADTPFDDDDEEEDGIED